MKIWFNRLARETLAGDHLTESELHVATGNTMAKLQGYPSLPSDNSGSEIEMEGSSNPPTDNMAVIMGQLQQILAKQAITDKTLADIQKKNTDQAFTKTWEDLATPETQDPIGRVIALLETAKQKDSQGHYVSLLKAEVAAGRATLYTYAKLSKAEAAFKKKLREFYPFAPPYNGNPNKVFNWYKEMEKHLSRYECEMIPITMVKMMLLDCIEGKAQSEVVFLKPVGLPFENYEIGEFFQELLKKFTHENDKEGRKMKFMARKQAWKEDAR